MYMYQQFMKDKVLIKRRYTGSNADDHEHCVMCGAKFSLYEGDLRVGFITQDSNHWVCPECFKEYHALYNWHLST